MLFGNVHRLVHESFVAISHLGQALRFGFAEIDQKGKFLIDVLDFRHGRLLIFCGECGVFHPVKRVRTTARKASKALELKLCKEY